MLRSGGENFVFNLFLRALNIFISPAGDGDLLGHVAEIVRPAPVEAKHAPLHILFLVIPSVVLSSLVSRT